MQRLSRSLLAFSFSIGVSCLSAYAETRSVDHVIWETSSPTQLNLSNIPKNKSQLIFVRLNDNLPSTTSSNISVDNRYQISLQSNHLSKVLVCSGAHKLSAQTTENKSNDLSFTNQTIRTEPAQTYFFEIKVDAQGNNLITPLSSNTRVDSQRLVDYLSTIPQQSHQISRVVADCPEYIEPVIVKPAPRPAPQLPQVEFNKPLNLEVLFKFDSAQIEPVYNQRIAAVAQFMQQHPNTISMIEGHTDSVGKSTYNMKLSQQRASAVKQELINKYGITPNRINTIGYGETRPVDTNSTAAGRHNNRRVVATVTATKN